MAHVINSLNFGTEIKVNITKNKISCLVQYHEFPLKTVSSITTNFHTNCFSVYITMCFHLHRINYQVLLWHLKNEIKRLPTVSDGMALREAKVTKQEAKLAVGHYLGSL